MRALRPTLAAALGLLVATAGALPAGAAPAPAPEQRYLVQYAPGAATETVDEIRAHGVVDAVLPSVRTASAVLTADEAAALAEDEDVLLVEPDRKARVAALEQRRAPWGLDRIDQRPTALNGTYSFDADGRGVAIYVIDTGIRSNHVDLRGRVVPGFAILDGVGTEDCHGHGTHVAGIAGGSTHGVAKLATLVAVRPMECDGTGWYSDILRAMDWVVANHQAGVEAVANLSLEGEISQSLDAGVKAMVDDGITVTVAAGNDGVDACGVSPGRTPSAITVGASTRSDARASFSNFGSCVDLFAPGDLILSSDSLSSTDTWTRSGTSMAAPHVAGAAALLLQRDRTMTPAQVRAALTANATSGVLRLDDAGSPNRLLYTGAPPAAAQQLPVAPPAPVKVTAKPSAPSGVVARRTQRAVTVSWRAATDGGSPLTGSLVTVHHDGRPVRTVAVAGDRIAATLPGLHPHVAYTFTVASQNAGGVGPASRPSRPLRTRS